MCAIDLEPCSVWNETPRKARKPHVCQGCGTVISPGEHYLDHRHVFDGSAVTEAMCAPCWFAREDFVDVHKQSFAPSMLIEMLRECIAEDGEADEYGWRPMLAGILRRYRTSAGRRYWSRKRVAERESRS